MRGKVQYDGDASNNFPIMEISSLKAQTKVQKHIAHKFLFLPMMLPSARHQLQELLDGFFSTCCKFRITISQDFTIDETTIDNVDALDPQ